MTDLKLCPKCGEWKDISLFNKSSKKRGYSGHCKECNRIICRQYGQRRKIEDPTFLERERLRAEQRRSTRPQRVKQLVNSTRRSAAKRKIYFDLQEPYIYVMIECQFWRCLKTGIEFDLTSGQGIRPFGPSIDRIDSTKGYILGNIQIVCNIYNFAKNSFDHETVLTMARELIKRADNTN